jgi:hypothetical protein
MPNHSPTSVSASLNKTKEFPPQRSLTEEYVKKMNSPRKRNVSSLVRHQARQDR